MIQLNSFITQLSKYSQLLSSSIKLMSFCTFMVVFSAECKASMDIGHILDKVEQLAQTSIIDAQKLLETSTTTIENESYQYKTRWLLMAAKLAATMSSDANMQSVIDIANKVLPSDNINSQNWLELLKQHQQLTLQQIKPAISVLQTMEQDITNSSDTLLQAYYFSLLHYAFQLINVLDVSFDYGIKARKLWLSLEDYYNATELLVNLAKIKSEFKDYNGAEQDLAIALNEAQNLKAKLTISTIKFQQALLLEHYKQLPEALSALINLEKNFQITAEHPLFGELNFAAARISYDLGYYEDALRYTTTLIEQGNSGFFDFTKLLQARALTKLGKIDEATVILNEAEQIFKNNNDQIGLYWTSVVHIDLAYAKNDINLLYQQVQKINHIETNYNDNQGALRSARGEKAAQAEAMQQLASNLSEDNIEKTEQLELSLNKLNERTTYIIVLSFVILLFLVLFFWLIFALRRIRQLANTDALTGIYNRRKGLELAERTIKRALTNQTASSISVMDLDKFKAINDTYGHAAGDKVLKKVVEKVNSLLRPGDIFCRMGGEEFMLMLPDTNVATALTVLERLRNGICAIPTDMLSFERQISASFGVCAINPEHDESQALEKALINADEALYIAKNKGRNQVSAFAES